LPSRERRSPDRHSGRNWVCCDKKYKNRGPHLLAAGQHAAAVTTPVTATAASGRASVVYRRASMPVCCIKINITAEIVTPKPAPAQAGDAAGPGAAFGRNQGALAERNEKMRKKHVAQPPSAGSKHPPGGGSGSQTRSFRVWGPDATCRLFRPLSFFCGSLLLSPLRLSRQT